jgi:hypothetical protein
VSPSAGAGVVEVVAAGGGVDDVVTLVEVDVVAGLEVVAGFVVVVAILVEVEVAFVEVEVAFVEVVALIEVEVEVEVLLVKGNLPVRFKV